MDEFQLIFETERLYIRELRISDEESFFEMMNNPKVMNPIPRDVMDRPSSDANFNKHLTAESNAETKVWAIDTKKGDCFIGIGAFLINNDGEDEIGYRLREKYWSQGFGTEITKGLIEYGFNKLGLLLITADVNTENQRSVKILDKFFTRDAVFYNINDQCTDRRYKLTRTKWKDGLTSSE